MSEQRLGYVATVCVDGTPNLSPKGTLETRNYGATASFWKSRGFQNQFETDHGSGQWIHPNGGPYLFIAENGDEEHPLTTHPILAVADSTVFNPTRPADYLREFEPQHWGVVEALLRDPDGREVSLQAPLPPGTTAPNLDDHRTEIRLTKNCLTRSPSNEGPGSHPTLNHPRAHHAGKTQRIAERVSTSNGV